MIGNSQSRIFMLGMPCCWGICFWLISEYAMVLIDINRVKRLT